MMEPLVNFDIFEGIFGNDPLLSSPQKMARFNQVDQMSELGYSNFNAFLNMSSVTIFVCFYLLRVAIYGVVKLIHKIKEA